MKERLQNVPLQPGVYMFKDREGLVVYVGKAKALRNRMRSYFQVAEKMHPKVRAMMKRVADFDFIVTKTEVEALILENNLIKAYQPRYNIDLRDDKTYPYIKVSIKEKFPRVSVAREERDRESRYFGPFTDVTTLRETLKILNSIFPLRSCKSFRFKPRACLNRDMEKCLAPCVGQISEEAYREMVNGLLNFLEGNPGEVLLSKENEMKAAAANLEYEKAARLRDQIRGLETITAQQQKVVFNASYNLDLIGLMMDEQESLVLVFKIRSGKIIAKDSFWLSRPINEDEPEMMEFFLKQYYNEQEDVPSEIVVSRLPTAQLLMESWLKEKTGIKVELRFPRRGEKKGMLNMVLENAAWLWEEKKNRDRQNHSILLQLSKDLRLEVIPQRIECYDISHLGGEETVGSMVVFTEGLAERKSYRRFKIKTEQNNDFASLAEVLQRRFKKSREENNPAFLPEPDLIIVDGGLGQVNAAKMVLDEIAADIPVFGLAKKNEAIFKPGVGEALVLPRRDEGLKLLQRMRDEAHRFAVEYNRKRRARKIRVSALDDINGIGEERKKQLLTHFGSVSKIRSASLEELGSVPGMNRLAAQNVYRHFRENENNS
ncbi:MAG: excinuclease ABC subunit UvrC [Syntrophomonadaceae bacterium]|nr:excinuclease ABC subunit UvrC [Syntrophomonadaceae bacterium]